MAVDFTLVLRPGVFAPVGVTYVKVTYIKEARVFALVGATYFKVTYINASFVKKGVCYC
jgi:hypothetical protein